MHWNISSSWKQTKHRKYVWVVSKNFLRNLWFIIQLMGSKWEIMGDSMGEITWGEEWFIYWGCSLQLGDLVLILWHQFCKTLGMSLTECLSAAGCVGVEALFTVGTPAPVRSAWESMGHHHADQHTSNVSASQQAAWEIRYLVCVPFQRWHIHVLPETE